ncbi:hypothetical protein GCM10027290_00650 [Micromonospora sonneratiae]|uniref:Uncharacterized protein n=1 Tax=Micromonospora sonneratiae TaxID=1184706 RepID=A0ABW3Y5T0_9ACTN
MAEISGRPRIRALVTAAAVAGGLVLGMASPAHADYRSPLYHSLSACNAARPAYASSWTSPGPCWAVYYWVNGQKRTGWYFTVKTRS